MFIKSKSNIVSFYIMKMMSNSITWSVLHVDWRDWFGFLSSFGLRVIKNIDRSSLFIICFCKLNSSDRLCECLSPSLCPPLSISLSFSPSLLSLSISISYTHTRSRQHIVVRSRPPLRRRERTCSMQWGPCRQRFIFWRSGWIFFYLHLF